MFSVVTKCDFVSEFPFIWQACLANRKTHPQLNGGSPSSLGSREATSNMDELDNGSSGAGRSKHYDGNRAQFNLPRDRKLACLLR